MMPQTFYSDIIRKKITLKSVMNKKKVASVSRASMARPRNQIQKTESCLPACEEKGHHKTRKVLQFDAIATLR